MHHSDISDLRPAYLDRQIHRRVRHAVLEVIREQDLNRLGPQRRLGVLDMLCHICFALPMEYVDKLALRQLLSVWQGSPNEVLELRKSRGDVHYSLALFKLDGCRHALPEICHRVDDMSALESALEAFGIVKIRLDKLDTLFSQFLAFRGCSVSRQTADVVFGGLLQECLHD